MIQNKKTQLLRQSGLLSSLKPGELGELADLADERCFENGEFIFWEGDPPERFFVVGSGKVKMLKHISSGKDFIIAVFVPGDMFGEVAMFDGSAYPASAQASGETCVLSIKRDDFLAFLGRNPPVSVKIIGVLGSRLREAHARLRDLAGERVMQRLAGTLLLLSAKLGPTIPFTRQEIADMSGTTTETTIRVLSRLKSGGIISSTRGKITVLDQKKLKLLAEGPPEM